MYFDNGGRNTVCIGSQTWTCSTTMHYTWIHFLVKLKEEEEGRQTKIYKKCQECAFGVRGVEKGDSNEENCGMLRECRKESFLESAFLFPIIRCLCYDYAMFIWSVLCS